jgi:hypothetical protein
MKRLMPFVSALAIAATTTLTAQSKDLAGTWLIDAAKSAEKSGKAPGPPMMVLTLTDKEFTARMGSANGPAMSFKLDGTETTGQHGEKTKAAWKGNKLDATIISENGVPETITFSRDGEWLVMEGTMPKHGPVKFYFKKAPAKP